MTRYLSLAEVLKLHDLIIKQTGGSEGLRDLGMLESSLGQPRQTFAGQNLYSTLAGKTSALGFSLIMNHPFIDGNKRIGHASVDAFLMLNGSELFASVDDGESEILAVAAGQRSREQFQEWIEQHLRPLDPAGAT